MSCANRPTNQPTNARRNPVTTLNWVGSAIAILGTYLYSLAMEKQKAEQKKKAA